MLLIDGTQILVVGVLVIYVLQRVTRWMHRRGWIQWKLRGTSSSLGNAVMGVQVFYQPQVREVLEARADELGEAGESGDPPDPDPQLRHGRHG